ncbi:MAG: hypothetical protein AUG51_18985 [Acidobacteria bacterium 13_1_20CM_3_53_8]|nr:MAG: hypothetical protein AUG51_18985 [Acidobacteria bacterium 13_1_20CM_3_53_8]
MVERAERCVRAEDLIPGLQLVGVRHEGVRHLDRRRGVDRADALREHVLGACLEEGAGQRVRSPHQRGLDERGGERPVGFEHQRDRAGDDGRGEGGAVVVVVGPRQSAVRRGLNNAVGTLRRRVRVLLRHRRDDAAPRRDQVGLNDVVNERRAVRGELRHRVVGATGGAARVGRADRDRVGAVAGAVNAAVDGAVQGVAVLPVADDLVRVAVVACGGDDDDAVDDCALDRFAERVVAEGLAHARAEAEVDDADVVALLVDDGPVDCVHRRAGRAHAVRVEHLEVNDAGFGGDADVARAVAEGGRAVAGGDARHARPVSVAVARARAREVNGGDDARLAVLLEVWVRGADAAVNDRDADALARQAGHALKACLRERRARRLARHGQLAADLSVGRDVCDVFARGEVGDCVLRHDRRQRVERVEGVALRAALRLDRVLVRRGRAALGLYDDADEIVRRGGRVEFGGELRV